MQAIERVRARTVLDSRANWTVEVEVNGFQGAAPSGASTGSREAKVIEPERAAEFINNTLAKKLIGVPMHQGKIDALLEKNMSGLGSGGAVALSYAVFNCLWQSKPPPKSVVFPYPLGNVFGGGAHGGSVDIQEVLISPLEAKTFPEAISNMTNAYHSLKKTLVKNGTYTGVNDEGALTAKIEFEKLIDLVCKIAETNGCRVGLDVAASSLWDRKKYVYKNEGVSRVPEKQIEYMVELAEKYNLFYIEDPLHEDDFEGFAALKSKVKKTFIVGDDLTVTNTMYLLQAIRKHSVSGIIIKPNQIGTVSQTLEAVTLCKKSGILPTISHRSAETTDATIARMALAAEIPLIKCGIAGIRVAKLNELLRQWDSAPKKAMAKI